MRFLVIYDTPGWSMHRQAEGCAKWHGTEHEVLTCHNVAEIAGAEGPSETRTLGEFMDTIDVALHMSWFSSWGATRNRHGLRFRRNAALVTSDGFLFDGKTPWVDDYHQLIATRHRNSTEAAKTLPQFDALLAGNAGYHAQLLDMGFRSYYAPGGVDHHLFVPKTKPGRGSTLRIGWCGQVSVGNRPNVKGYELLLVRIMENLSHRNEIEFVVNGAAHNSPDRVTPESMVDWYNDIDLLLVTSVCEGTPTPALEAMACGRMVLGTSVGVLPEMNGGTMLVGTYSNVSSAQWAAAELTTCIEELASRGDRVQSLGRDARHEIVERWSWQKRAREYIDAMVEVATIGGGS